MHEEKTIQVRFKASKGSTFFTPVPVFQALAGDSEGHCEEYQLRLLLLKVGS